MTPALPDDLVDGPDFKKFMELTAEADRYLDNLVENDPEALAELRRLLLEGLESGVEGELNEEWWQSLAEGIQKRARARSR